ncbi:hypothetical protein H8959_002408, partial [Pygathrix nigripes]
AMRKDPVVPVKKRTHEGLLPPVENHPLPLCVKEKSPFDPPGAIKKGPSGLMKPPTLSHSRNRKTQAVLDSGDLPGEVANFTKPSGCLLPKLSFLEIEEHINSTNEPENQSLLLLCRGLSQVSWQLWRYDSTPYREPSKHSTRVTLT